MVGARLAGLFVFACGCGRVGFDVSDANGPAGDESTSGMLAANFAAQTTDVDLTAVGTADWSHWGLNNAASFDHKATGGQITLVGTGSLFRYTNNGFSFTWSDGAPTAATVETLTGVSIMEAGKAIRITAPASTTQRTLQVFTDVFRSTATVTATLSDGSASAYSDPTFDAATGIKIRIYTFTYRADTDGSSLKVTLTLDTVTENGSNLAVPAAVLTSP